MMPGTSAASEYGDGERFFLQTIMAHGLLTHGQVKQVLQRCSSLIGQPLNVETDMSRMISRICVKINHLQMDIVRLPDERDAKARLVFVNKNAETIMHQFGSEFSEAKQYYIRNLLVEISEQPAGFLTFQDALQLASSMDLTMNGGRKVKPSEAQAVIERLVERNYLHDNMRRLRLSCRAILECESWFRNFVRCHICATAAYYALRCDACGTKAHLKCAKVANLSSCPRCNEMMTAPVQEIALNNSLSNSQHS